MRRNGRAASQRSQGHQHLAHHLKVSLGHTPSRGIPAGCSQSSRINTTGWRKSRFSVAVAAVIALTVVGCGGGAASSTSTATQGPPHSAILGHRIAESLSMFSGGPDFVLRRFGKQFRRLSPTQQKAAVRAAARDFDHSGFRITHGRARAVLTGLVQMER